MKKAKLKFLDSLDEPLVYIPSKGGGDATDHIGNFTMQEVCVRDGRSDLSSTDLDVEGFRLVSQETGVDDFYDDTAIESIYHSELKTLLTDITGAVQIEIFDDTRRTSSLRQQREKNIREPADIVHNDYTARSGLKRMQDYFANDPGKAEELEQRRFAIVNAWRSIAGPVVNHPLALCDATTTKSDDLVAVERRAEDRIGELQVALYNPDQRWYYFPEMQMNEALLFKTFDTETDGRTRFTIHTSFDDTDATASAPPRESIETRCLLFF